MSPGDWQRLAQLVEEATTEPTVWRPIRDLNPNKLAALLREEAKRVSAAQGHAIEHIGVPGRKP